MVIAVLSALSAEDNAYAKGFIPVAFSGIVGSGSGSGVSPLSLSVNAYLAAAGVETTLPLE